MRYPALLAGTAAALLMAAAPASAEMVHYKAMLSPSTEVPPNSSTGSGSLDATYDTDTHMLTYEATYKGLTGPATMAHFHGPAPAGKNAGVMVPITGDLASPIKGSAKLTDDQAKALMDGDVYFNIHTTANKSGEMRGQVEKAM